ncbi:MAG: sulfatase-like hydrolase/transferase [Rhodospirillaceae bacterium]|jgi:arylsulfatase|nr:sulfatase-like hydrolase/transferase [Rhodospirillaceae bacterium]
MRFDTIAALGNSHIRTPNIDKLISNGVALENCYVQNQLCTPSRASFLTGRYPAAHQVYRNGNAYFPDHEVLVTKILADAGYDCGLIGKLHLSSASTVETRPDDGYRLFEWCQNPGWEKVEGSNAYWIWLKEKKEVDPTTLFNAAPPYLGVGVTTELHQLAWCAETAIDFIDEEREGPWMLSVNSFDPHPPFDPPPEYLDNYDPNNLPPPLFEESDIARQQEFATVRNQKLKSVNPVLTEEERAEFAPGPGDERGAKPPERFDGLGIKAAYYAMIENLDHQFGRIVDHLKAVGQIDNTIIVFSSDHGEMLGDHGLIYKGCKFFEGLVHVPLIFSMPSTYMENERRQALVESIDIAPTLLEAAGIDRPYYMQGKSLQSLLTGAKLDDHHKDVVVTDFNDSLGTSEVDHYTQASMTFDGRYKLAVYHSHDGLGELYDLKSDPDEFDNLWSNANHQELKHKLIARHLDVMMGCVPPGIERISRA